MSLTKILASTVLASSLLIPSYAQSPQDYLIGKAINEVKDTTSEKIIGEVIDRLVTKPIIKKGNFLWNQNLDYCGLIFDEVKFSRQTVGISDWIEVNPASVCISYYYDKESQEFEFGMETANVLSRYYLGEENTPERKAILGVPRFNVSETKIFVLHPREITPEVVYESARYLSEKTEKLEPLEESLTNQIIIEGGKKLVAATLRKLKIPNAEKYLEKAEEKYLSREKEVMDEFAKELNPDFIATKIPLYPARIFGEKEIERVIQIRMQNEKNENLPFAVYMKPTFGDPETGIGSLEILFRN